VIKVGIIVEGLSDKLLIDKIISEVSRDDLESNVYIGGSKEQIIKDADKHYKVNKLLGCQHIIFVIDQDRCLCITEAKDLIKLKEEVKAIRFIVCRELEAWILADGQAVTSVSGKSYSPAGITDGIDGPKEVLGNLIRRIGYLPSELEMVNMILPHFSITRCIRNNNSANRFYQLLRDLH
jgi:hypothetical protein